MNTPIKKPITFAFVGSSKLDEEQYSSHRDLFYRIAYRCAELGINMRSGASAGADIVAEQAYSDAIDNCITTLDKVQIFTPWRRFQAYRGKDNPLHLYQIVPSDSLLLERSHRMVCSIHPAANRLSAASMKLHMRNTNQVLGLDLESPINACICFTPNGNSVGGTRTAIELSRRNGIPVFNIGRSDVKDVLVQLDELIRKLQEQ